MRWSITFITCLLAVVVTTIIPVCFAAENCGSAGPGVKAKAATCKAGFSQSREGDKPGSVFAFPSILLTN